VEGDVPPRLDQDGFGKDDGMHEDDKLSLGAAIYCTKNPSSNPLPLIGELRKEEEGDDLNQTLFWSDASELELVSISSSSLPSIHSDDGAGNKIYKLHVCLESSVQLTC
jgi:hypothetical protein